MNTENFKIRLICLFFAMICAGGYILVLYPAFQIPMFFVFLMIAILSGMSTMNRFVRQQRVQIGTLKAFGFKNRKIYIRHRNQRKSKEQNTEIFVAKILFCFVNFQKFTDYQNYG